MVIQRNLSYHSGFTLVRKVHTFRPCKNNHAFSEVSTNYHAEAKQLFLFSVSIPLGRSRLREKWMAPIKIKLPARNPFQAILLRF